MSSVREKFVKAVESLPYEIDKEIFQKDTFSILKDVTQKYVDMFGINDLSEEDRVTIKTVIGNKV